MKKIPDALQHTQSVLALSIVAMNIEYFSYPEKLNDKIQQIKRWQEASANKTKKRALSQGAKRDLEKVATLFCKTLESESKNLNRCMGIGWWCAWALLVDAKAVCPNYTQGKEWKYLLQTVETLCFRLLEDFDMPEIEIKGSELYEQITLC